jgi:hypothetical protein
VECASPHKAAWHGWQHMCGQVGVARRGERTVLGKQAARAERRMRSLSGRCAAASICRVAGSWPAARLCSHCCAGHCHWHSCVEPREGAAATLSRSVCHEQPLLSLHARGPRHVRQVPPRGKLLWPSMTCLLVRPLSQVRFLCPKRRRPVVGGAAGQPGDALWAPVHDAAWAARARHRRRVPCPAPQHCAACATSVHSRIPPHVRLSAATGARALDLGAGCAAA